MKSRVIILLALLGLTFMKAPAATVTLTGGSGHPGDEVTVALAMSGDEAVCAIDMTLPLADNLTYVAGSAELAPRAAATHHVSASTVDGSLRLVIYSLDLSTISGTEGDVARFKLHLGNKPGDYTLSPTVILSDAMGEPINATVESGCVTDLCPELAIVSETIDYGHIPIRSTYTSLITLRNSGNLPLTINSLTPSDPSLEVTVGDEIIAPGMERDFTLSYSPSTRGAFSGYVEVDCDGVNNLIHGKRQRVTVVADPFSVNELHMARAEGASDTEVTVGVRVNNMEPLVGAQFDLNLPEGLTYVEGSTMAAPRARGKSVVANMNDRKLTLLLYSLNNAPIDGDDGTLLTFKLRLEGHSGWYWLNPENVVLSNADSENMTSAVEGNYVIIQSPTISGDNSLNFGHQPVTEPITAAYRVSNSGEIPLVIDRVTFLAEGFECNTQLPLSVNQWESATIDVAYNTTACGDFTGVMNIYSNDPEQRMKAVAMSGVSFSPNELSITGDYSPADNAGTLTVGLTNHAQISAVQMDLTVNHPEQLSGELTLSLAERAASHSAVIKRVADDRWRIVLYSLSNAPIAGNEGPIFNIGVPMNDVTVDNLTFAIVSSPVISDLEGKDLHSAEPSLPQEFTMQFPATIGFDKSRYSLKPGMELTVQVTVGPENAIGKDYTLSIADESVATLNQAGVLTALAEGVTTITATTWNGVTATAEVYVADVLVPVENISLDCDAITLLLDGTRQLVATVTPGDADDTSVTWTSSAPEVATVDNNGVVTAIAIGQAIITATASNGMTARCDVTVTDVVFPVTVDGVTYDLIDNRLWVTRADSDTPAEVRLAAELGGNLLYGIADNAFYGLQIFHCEIPEGVQVVGNDAFAYSMLTMVILPSTLRSLGYNAFSGVDLSVVFDKAPADVSLLNANIAHQSNRIVYVPSESYDEYAGSDSESPVYTGIGEMFEVDGLWFIPVDDTSAHLVSCRVDMPGKYYVIPDVVTHNGKEMTVTRINRFAFDGMSRAYGYKVDFARSIDIPQSVGEIAPEAFCNIPLSEVKVHYPDPRTVNTDENAFSGVPYENCALRVPESSMELYKDCLPWSNFSIHIPTGVDSVISDEGSAVYYDLYGNRVTNPGHGIYIMRRGNKTVKIVM